MNHRLYTIIACLWLGLALNAKAGALPSPPCEDAKEVFPAIPPQGSNPAIIVFESSKIAPFWQPPDCLGWSIVEDGAATLIALAARPAISTLEPLVARLAANSELESVLYWSTKRQTWRPLLAAARTVDNPVSLNPIADPTPNELVAGSIVYSVQDDNDPLTPIVNEMKIIKRGEHDLHVNFENISAAKMLGLTVLPKGAAHTSLFVQRDHEGWFLYSISRIASSLPGWLMPSKASHINRATALYRYLLGIKTDLEPPAAP